MNQSPFDERITFDGTVGAASKSGEATAPSLWPDDSQIHVFASGDMLSDVWTMGLADDVRVLVEAFTAGGAGRCREMTGDGPRSPNQSKSPDPDDDINVMMHGIVLDAEGGNELRDLIRMVAQERLRRPGDSR